MTQRENRTDLEPLTSRPTGTLVGLGLVWGAGTGSLVGLLVAGGPGLALGGAAGAGLGIVAGAALELLNSRSHRPQGR